MSEVTDLLKKHSEAVEKQIEALSPDIAKALRETGVLTARVTDLEQKAVGERGPSGGGFETKSWGNQFIASDGLRAFADNRSHPSRYRLDIETKAVISGGGLTPPDIRPEPVIMARRRLTVRSLIPVIPTASGSVQFPKQTVRTNNAAPVAEAAAKPQSDYTFVMETVPVQTLAHWVLATRQILDDAPMLAATIDQELRYGLQLVEEAQLLNGDGVSPNLDGLIPNATAYAPPFIITTPTIIDQLGLALLQVALADHEPSGIVLHPSDAMAIRLLKDVDGNYIMGPPGAAIAPMLFGLPVVATPAITVDKFLVGAFPQASTIFDRQSATVELSTEDSDNFRKNLVTIRAEERLAQAIRDGSALVTGDLGNVALTAREGGSKSK